tara:strand:+ start:42 stop:716 length:675 start_codon:yes stop_codon:yes gene_type:complete
MIDWSIRRRVVIPEPSSHSEDDVKNWSAIGRIYEHLACYYLSSVGFKAEIKDAAGYDILAECPDGNFFKVEVKSSTPRSDKSIINYGGMSNKACADVFMFFDRTTNHMLLKFAEEINCSLESRGFSPSAFSDYNTQKSLSRLGGFVPEDKLSYVSPLPQEAVKLNRAWVLANMDMIHKLRNNGIWSPAITKLFGLGDRHWIKRICREDRNGITDSARRIAGIIK